MEAEPNYERARRSLGLDPPGDLVGGDEPLDPSVAEAAKSVTITANGDNRVLAFNNPFTNESLAYAFYETGGTGTMVGWRIYTAGHVLWNNAAMPLPDGFVCRDGVIDGTAPYCSTQGHPRWRWGGRIVGGAPTFTTGWTLCGFKLVPNGWVSLPANSTVFTAARWDYGLQNLDGCIPGSGVGNVGWWLANQAQLRTRNLWQAGYPSLFTCPALRAGASQASEDCPASGSQGVVQRLPGLGIRPYTGANLFWASSTGTGADNSLIVTGGYMESSKIDTTAGQSGGAVITFEQNAWRAVGTTSNTNNGAAETRFNHLTTEVKDFLYQ